MALEVLQAVHDLAVHAVGEDTEYGSKEGYVSLAVNAHMATCALLPRESLVS